MKPTYWERETPLNSVNNRNVTMENKVFSVRDSYAPPSMSIDSSCTSSPFDLTITEALVDQARHPNYYHKDGNVVFILSTFLLACDSYSDVFNLQIEDTRTMCIATSWLTILLTSAPFSRIPRPLTYA